MPESSFKRRVFYSDWCQHQHFDVIFMTIVNNFRSSLVCYKQLITINLKHQSKWSKSFVNENKRSEPDCVNQTETHHLFPLTVRVPHTRSDSKCFQPGGSLSRGHQQPIIFNHFRTFIQVSDKWVNNFPEGRKTGYW